MNNENEVLKDNLDRQFEEEEKKNKRNKILKKITAICAAIVLSVIAFISCNASGKKNKSQNNTNNKITPTLQVSDDDIEIDNLVENDEKEELEEVVVEKNTLEDLGIELEIPQIEEIIKNEYTNPSNDKVDTNKIVEDEKGTLWSDEESKEESVNVGKVEIDTKDDSLVVKEDGNVYQKEEEYEIIDEETKEVISSGKLDEDTKYTPDGTPIPEGYAWDTNRKEIVLESEVGKYVYSNSTYYFEDGSIAIVKGDLVTKDYYEYATKKLSTVKSTITVTPKPTVTVAPTVTSKPTVTPKPTVTVAPTVTPKPTVTVAPTPVIENTIDQWGGVTNEDGTYTIYEVTYQSKADFEQSLLTPDAYEYVIIDNVLWRLSTEQLKNQKTFVK